MDIPQIDLVMAHEQALTRAGILATLGAAIHLGTTEEFTEREQLADRLNQKLPGLLVINFSLLDPILLRQIAGLRTSNPGFAVVVLFERFTKGSVLSVVEAGINNCIAASAQLPEFLEAVNAALENRNYLSNQILQLLVRNRRTPAQDQSGTGRITPAEQEIVRLIARGNTSREIAVMKRVSYHTVITHRKNIFRKLSITKLSELMLYAMHSGLVESIDYSI